MYYYMNGDVYWFVLFDFPCSMSCSCVQLSYKIKCKISEKWEEVECTSQKVRLEEKERERVRESKVFMLTLLQMHSEMIQITKPFDMAYKLMNVRFKPTDYVLYDEPFIIVTEIHCTSPWQLHIAASQIHPVSIASVRYSCHVMCACVYCYRQRTLGNSRAMSHRLKDVSHTDTLLLSFNLITFTHSLSPPPLSQWILTQETKPQSVNVLFFPRLNNYLLQVTTSLLARTQ